MTRDEQIDSIIAQAASEAIGQTGPIPPYPLAKRAVELALDAGLEEASKVADEYGKCALISGVVFHDPQERKQCGSASRTAHAITAAIRAKIGGGA